NSKSRVQTETYVRVAFGLFVVKIECHVHHVPPECVIDPERNLARVFDWNKLIRRRRIAQGPGLTHQHLRVSEFLVAQKAMIPTANLSSLVGGFLSFEPVKEVTHDRRMGLPAFCRGCEVSVPVQITGP